MTINEAIARVDDLRDNTVATDIKIAWLQMVDQQVYLEIIKGREGAEAMTIPDYRDNNGGRVLLVPPPYDMLYVYRLEAEICYKQQEIDRQANALTRYNELMDAFAKHYAREHRSLPQPPMIYY
ncbi:MAG: hypothetical protein II326_04580 [Clostridia bacterium]|nr:hypothetical protein [Clostridia bacterium]